MATTSIWAVKGWLGKLVVYVENPEKTENPSCFEKQGMTTEQAQGLSDVIDYAVQTKKTVEQTHNENAEIMQRFVSAINCRLPIAREEMMATKALFGKTDGVVAYHGYQSFAPGEATPEIAHEIGVKLAKQLWGEKYQVLVATHLDKGNHLHNHFVLNNVAMTDGKKYYRSEHDYWLMPHIRFHDLRHSAATNMHQLTGDFYTVGEILGHTLKGIGMSLGISTNFDATTATYVDVRLERKQTVLEAYHEALHPKETKDIAAQKPLEKNREAR